MIEWKKVKKLMDCFPGSIINHNGEFIAMIKENEYFILENCKDEREIKCKVLACFSRGAHKTAHYNSKKKNNLAITGSNNLVNLDDEAVLALTHRFYEKYNQK